VTLGGVAGNEVKSPRLWMQVKGGITKFLVGGTSCKKEMRGRGRDMEFGRGTAAPKNSPWEGPVIGSVPWCHDKKKIHYFKKRTQL